MKKKDVKIEDKQVAALRDGMKSVFWLTLKGIIEDEKSAINATILANDEDQISKEKISDLIKLHSMFDYLSNLPEKCIKQLEPVEVKDDSDESNDPYDSPAGELRTKIIKK